MNTDMIKAFLTRDLFVVKGFHFTVGLTAVIVLAVYWFYWRKR